MKRPQSIARVVVAKLGLRRASNLFPFLVLKLRLLLLERRRNPSLNYNPLLSKKINNNNYRKLILLLTGLGGLAILFQ